LIIWCEDEEAFTKELVDVSEDTSTAQSIAVIVALSVGSILTTMVIIKKKKKTPVDPNKKINKILKEVIKT